MIPSAAAQDDATAAIDPALIDGPRGAGAPGGDELATSRGRVTVRAVRYDEGLDLDGVLDEPVYAAVRAPSRAWCS